MELPILVPSSKTVFAILRGNTMKRKRRNMFVRRYAGDAFTIYGEKNSRTNRVRVKRHEH
jgi:hypothetical protein